MKKHEIKIDIFKWRQYIDYLRKQTALSGRILGQALGLSNGTISFWNTKFLDAIRLDSFKKVADFAAAHNLKTYREYIDLAKVQEARAEKAIKEIEAKKVIESEVTEIIKEGEIKVLPRPRLKQNQIVVDVGETCIDCRFCEVEKQEHFVCILFRKHLYSNAEGDILKTEECK